MHIYLADLAHDWSSFSSRYLENDMAGFDQPSAVDLYLHYLGWVPSSTHSTHINFLLWINIYLVAGATQPLRSCVLCLCHIHPPTGFIGRHLGVFCILLSNHNRETFVCRCGWFGTHDLDDRPSSADNPKTVCRGDGVKLPPSIGMLSADVCQASVGRPPTSTDDGPMFQPRGRRSADIPRCRSIVGRFSGGIGI
jgi:hypothetical protein